MNNYSHVAIFFSSWPYFLDIKYIRLAWMQISNRYSLQPAQLYNSRFVEKVLCYFYSGKLKHMHNSTIVVLDPVIGRETNCWKWEWGGQSDNTQSILSCTCIHSLISIFIIQPQNPLSFWTIKSSDIISSSCSVTVRLTFASWVRLCIERVATPAYWMRYCLHFWTLHTNEQTNKYTLAEIWLPCTTISCLASRSAISSMRASN